MKARAADVGDPPNVHRAVETRKTARGGDARPRRAESVPRRLYKSAIARVAAHSTHGCIALVSIAKSSCPRPTTHAQHHQPPPGVTALAYCLLFFRRAIVSETLYRIDCHLLISAGGFSPPSLWIPRLSVHTISNHPTLKRKSKLEVAHRTLHFDSDQVR
jgi:hypothetical protein